MIIPDTINNLLPLIRKPGRYIGGELHATAKDWNSVDVRFALVFPDLYEIGMSHFGLQILYHLLNADQHTLAERCYCPDIDMENLLRQNDIPLYSLESRHSLADFDVIGITLPYELCYTNILTILDLAGVALRTNERGEEVPLVIGGGSCGLNPEPVADFFDVIVLGDGEEAILEISETLRLAKREGKSRAEILESLTEIDGVYVPSFFVPQYSGDELVAVQPLKPGYECVQRRVLPKLLPVTEMEHLLVPIVRPVHDRLGIEIARGCTRGCRFCQAGIIYRPVRERTMDEIMTIAEKGIKASGFDELALLSLSTGDYSCLPELMTRLMDRFANQYVSVSMPSMRVGTLTQEVMDQIKRVRKTGFTVAPEAGTDRLREVINKGISEADLLDTCQNAFALGWNLIKFYFMIGLPTETWEDVDEIVELAKKARAEAGPSAKRIQINVSVGTFVPKPHTPFQWERQLSLEESKERIDHLKSKLPRKGFKLKWHDPHQSYMEGVFSRGDRRLSSVIETAWKSGVRLDGWSEHYRLENWQKAAASCGIDLDKYLEQRDLEKTLPWDHLDSGVDKEFLVQEYRNAIERNYTPDCRNKGCQKCGLCDFKTIFPHVHPKKDAIVKQQTQVLQTNKQRKEQDKVYSYRVYYTRLGDTRFYSHLEILQLLFRVLTRAGIDVLHTQGFNPSPRVSFSPALSVGMESEVEYFDMDLGQPLSGMDEIISRLNRELPSGMKVKEIRDKPAKEPEALLVRYEIVLVDRLTDAQQENISRFLATDRYSIEQTRKKKRREIDIRPLVSTIVNEGNLITVEMIIKSGKASINPKVFLQEVVGLPEEKVLLARIKKAAVAIFSANP